MSPRLARVTGITLFGAIVLLAGAADRIATHDPARQFSDFVFAPPMRPHIVDSSRRWRWPFVYPLRLEDRLARRYSEDRMRPLPLRWFSGARLLSTDDGLWFPLGTDALGRDVFARLVTGARLSLGIALAAAAGALLIGVAVGGLAGLFGGATDDVVMRLADFIIALPGIYVVLTLRAALPLVLSTAQVFGTTVAVFAAVGWPVVARAVRAVVAAERRREYADAARAAGAGRTRLLIRHLLPAAAGVIAVQTTLLLPAFILAEATLSFVGLGFADATPSWGVMLQDAAGTRMLIEAPWLLAPAILIVCTVLSINLIIGPQSSRSSILAPTP
jgi:peptide/nickel transport system permease protein